MNSVFVHATTDLSPKNPDVEDVETPGVLSVRVRALVASSKADARPSLTSEQARRYLDDRLFPLFGEKAP